MQKVKAPMLLVLLSSLALARALPAQDFQGASSPNVRGTATAHLRSYAEVPALSTPGSGDFVGTINAAGTEINYQLRFSGLQGKVTQSHLHFAQPGVNGAIMIFLCSNLGNGPTGTQACPTGGGTISGVIHAADVIGNTQGIAPGELFEIIQGIRGGVVYANVHTDLFPGGEIRGQVQFTHH
ncbi:MAG TPA: CHRD domain-containing protein [Thermoanaerobaculia bacterium]|nr:CHRD domain-containing protein [Thermoanaerobaculia bacterium]